MRLSDHTNRKLPKMKSCIPNSYKQSTKAMTHISRAIYGRFTTIIPSTNKVIMDMIKTFIKNRNGYALL